MKKEFKFIGYVLLCASLIAGCVKKNIYTGGDEGDAAGGKLDFSTTQDVQLSLAYKVPEGFRGKFEAYMENPLYVDQYGNYLKKEDAEPFMAGYTKAGGTVDFQMGLPAYASEVYVYSDMTGVPVLLSAGIENGKVVLNNNSSVAPKASMTTQAAKKPYYSKWEKSRLTWKTFNTWSNEGKPADLIEPGITIGKRELEIINATIPQSKLLDARFCGLDYIELSEEAHVKLFYVSNGSSQRVNGLAYYVFKGDMPENNAEAKTWIDNNLILLYPNLSEAALQPGNGIQLKYYNEGSGRFEDKFPAGVKIGFVLLVDAWQGNGKVNPITNVMYSYSDLNRFDIPGQQIADKPSMALFKAEDKVILSFEDQPWTESPGSPYLGDFRDNVFVLDVDPVSALPDEIPDGKEPDTPSGETVDFYNNYGVLAFEDIWPYKGDYDMNDVVIKYKSTTYCNSDWMITGAVDTFVFLHNGAQYENGFGYQMGIPATAIEKIIVESDYTCQGQGLDASLDKATVMLFDDGKKVAPGTVFVVKVWLKDPSSPIFGYTFAPYNPFITINGFLNQGRKEVHLVNYAPTFKADLSLLGYGNDLSDPEKGIYYVSDAKFPFAFNLDRAKEYVIPTEAQRIDNFYPQFNDWVSSDLKDFTDWYLHPVKK